MYYIVGLVPHVRCFGFVFASMLICVPCRLYISISGAFVPYADMYHGIGLVLSYLMLWFHKNSDYHTLTGG